MEEEEKIRWQKLADKMKEKEFNERLTNVDLKSREEERKRNVADFEKKRKVIVSYCENVNEVFKAAGLKEQLKIDIQPDTIDKVFKRYYYIYFTSGTVNYNTPFLSFELRTFNNELEITRKIPLDRTLSLNEVKPARAVENSHYEGYIRNFVEACTGFKL